MDKEEGYCKHCGVVTELTYGYCCKCDHDYVVRIVTMEEIRENNRRLEHIRRQKK